jgi:hypothetical protein
MFRQPLKIVGLPKRRKIRTRTYLSSNKNAR